MVILVGVTGTAYEDYTFAPLRRLSISSKHLKQQVQKLAICATQHMQKILSHHTTPHHTTPHHTTPHHTPTEAPAAGHVCSNHESRLGSIRAHLYDLMDWEDRVWGESTTCAITASSLKLRRANTRRPLTHCSLQAVKACHDHKVMRQDLKPENSFKNQVIIQDPCGLCSGMPPQELMVALKLLVALRDQRQQCNICLPAANSI